MTKDCVVGFGVGLLTGAVVGGAVALLFAPVSGEEMRDIIKDETEKALDAIEQEATSFIKKK